MKSNCPRLNVYMIGGHGETVDKTTAIQTWSKLNKTVRGYVEWIEKHPGTGQFSIKVR